MSSHDKHIIEMQAGQVENLLSLMAERFEMNGATSELEKVQAALKSIGQLNEIRGKKGTTEGCG